MTLNNNHAPNNSGIFVVTEIIMPLLILSLTLTTDVGSANSPKRSPNFAGSQEGDAKLFHIRWPTHAVAYFAASTGAVGVMSSAHHHDPSMVLRSR